MKKIIISFIVALSVFASCVTHEERIERIKERHERRDTRHSTMDIPYKIVHKSSFVTVYQIDSVTLFLFTSRPDIYGDLRVIKLDCTTEMNVPLIKDVNNKKGRIEIHN